MKVRACDLERDYRRRFVSGAIIGVMYAVIGSDLSLRKIDAEPREGRQPHLIKLSRLGSDHRRNVRRHRLGSFPTKNRRGAARGPPASPDQIKLETLIR
jgi:hypothetical protein